MMYPSNAFNTPNSMGGKKADGTDYNLVETVADSGELTDSNAFNDFQRDNVAERRELKNTLDQSIQDNSAGKLTGANLYGEFADDVVYPTDLRRGSVDATGMTQSIEDLQLVLNNLKTEVTSLIGTDGISGSLSTLNVTVTSSLGNEKSFAANALNLKVNMAVAKAMNLAYHLKRLNKQVEYISAGYAKGMLEPADVVYPSGMFRGY